MGGFRRFLWSPSALVCSCYLFFIRFFISLLLIHFNRVHFSFEYGPRLNQIVPTTLFNWSIITTIFVKRWSSEMVFESPKECTLLVSVKTLILFPKPFCFLKPTTLRSNVLNMLIKRRRLEKHAITFLSVSFTSRPCAVIFII